MRTLFGIINILLAGQMIGCATLVGIAADPETKLLRQTVTVDMLYINGVLERGDSRVFVSIFQGDCRSGSGRISITGDFLHARDNVAAKLEGQDPGDKLFTELCAIGMRLVAQQQREKP